MTDGRVMTEMTGYVGGSHERKMGCCFKFDQHSRLVNIAIPKNRTFAVVTDFNKKISNWIYM